MKALRSLIIMVFSLVPLAANAIPMELFFSEYIEGTGNNKALEIYNGTGSSVNMSSYSVQMFYNGSSTAGLTLNFFGTVASGDVFVLAHSSAVQEILTQADVTNGAGWFNGNDAVALLKGTAFVDVIGQIGFNPGTEWGSGLTGTADNTLRRKRNVLGGDTNGFDAFDPSVEWEGFAVNTYDGLGFHSIEVNVQYVPEPAMLALLGLGLLGIGWSRRKPVASFDYQLGHNE